MATHLNQLVDQFEQGVLNRRQLFKGLALLASAGSLVAEAEAAAAAPAGSQAIAPVLSINHTHFIVSDLQRSVEFYQAVLGATPLEAAKGIMTMTLPCSTNKVGAWISLSTPVQNNGGPMSGKPGTYNHVGYGAVIEPARINAELKARWPGIRTDERNETDQMFVYDPDGLPIQLMVIEHDGYIAKEKAPDGKGGTKDVRKYQPREHLIP